MYNIYFFQIFIGRGIWLKKIKNPHFGVFLLICNVNFAIEKKFFLYVFYTMAHNSFAHILEFFISYSIYENFLNLLLARFALLLDASNQRTRRA